MQKEVRQKRPYTAPKVFGVFHTKAINILSSLSTEATLEDWEDGGEL